MQGLRLSLDLAQTQQPVTCLAQDHGHRLHVLVLESPEALHSLESEVRQPDRADIRWAAEPGQVVLIVESPRVDRLEEDRRSSPSSFESALLLQVGVDQHQVPGPEVVHHQAAVWQYLHRAELKVCGDQSLIEVPVVYGLRTADSVASVVYSLSSVAHFDFGRLAREIYFFDQRFGEELANRLEAVEACGIALHFSCSFLRVLAVELIELELTAATGATVFLFVLARP